jgi:hypothetical protein
LLRGAYLPVGVTPVTAIPTRIVYGPEARAIVRFAEREEEVPVEIGRLGEFASERENPRNTKHVAAIRVELPEERLRDGAALVDTPGLGSLATLGASESLAYLPRADLGIVLVDGSSTLAPEDVTVVDALLRSGGKAMVLLSKADLLSTEDRERMRDYVRRHLTAEVGAEVPVYLVSVLGADALLADTWFDTQLLPVLRSQRALKADTLMRKAVAFCRTVAGGLRMHVERPADDPPVEPAAPSRRDEALQALREVAALHDSILKQCGELIDSLGDSVSSILEKSAEEMALNWRACRANPASCHEILASAATGFVSRTEKVLLVCLEGARSFMTRSLQLAAQAAHHTDDDDGEFPRPRGMPVFEATRIGELQCLPRAPLGFLGKRVRKSELRSQLDRSIGPSLKEALDFHSELLRNWCRTTLLEMEVGFEARAAGSRLRLERSELSLAVPGNVAVASVEHDLVSLAHLAGEPDGTDGRGPRS